MEIELNEWITVGTRLELSYPTDGLRLEGNKNFKFQYRITHDYLLKNDPRALRGCGAGSAPESPRANRKESQALESLDR